MSIGGQMWVGLAALITVLQLTGHANSTMWIVVALTFFLVRDWRPESKQEGG